MPDLHTRLLAEIERREGMRNGPLSVELIRLMPATSGLFDVMDAYLAALKEIVELHRAVERDVPTPSRTCIAAVADALDVAS